MQPLHLKTLTNEQLVMQALSVLLLERKHHATGEVSWKAGEVQEELEKRLQPPKLVLKIGPVTNRI